MTESLTHPVRPAVLNLVGSSWIESPETVAVEQWIDQAGMQVARCLDVYVGLARVLGTSQRNCHAVVVCVEDLSTGEFEFFSLLARAQRELPVLVYGSRSPERIVRALQAGAKGLATREVILALGAKAQRQTLREELVVNPATVPVPPLPEQPKAADVAAPPVDEASPVFALPTVESKDEVEDAPLENHELTEPTETARVPWLRYTDGPERQRPATIKEERGKSSPDNGIHASKTANGKRSNDCTPEYEPLLTEQELAALLGDDLDDVAIQEREMLTNEGEVPGSGTR